MVTHRSDIARWLEEGLEKKATHVIVVCDTFDYEDYPVYILPGQNVKDEINRISRQQMTRIMEVYNLSMDLNAQMSQRRAYNV